MTAVNRAQNRVRCDFLPVMLFENEHKNKTCPTYLMDCGVVFAHTHTYMHRSCTGAVLLRCEETQLIDAGEVAGLN